MKHLILLNSLPCYKCTDARTDSVNLEQDWLKCLHCNDSLYKPTQLIYKHTLTTDISGNMFHVKHPFPFDLKTSLQICGQSQVFQIIRYDWIKCFPAARFSAQTDSAYLQILETINIGNMFHVKHPSQFDRKTSIQICKQSQLSWTLLIELEHSNSIDIRGNMFHVKHIAYSAEIYPANVLRIAWYRKNRCDNKMFCLKHLLSLIDLYSDNSAE